MSRPAHILLVDDNVMDIEPTLDAFREKHLENSVRPVTSGEEALNYLPTGSPSTCRRPWMPVGYRV